MSSPEETRRVVMTYFEAWTANKVDDAFATLAPDLEFWGPTASYASAAAFKPALVGFAAMTKAARITEMIVEGDKLAMTYDCTLPEPVGTIAIASFFHVENGKIRAYKTLFDATQLRQLVAKKASDAG
jgi:ketosteroid isomerase-like protein